MRKVFIGLMSLALILLTPVAFAAVGVLEDGTYVGEAVTLDMPSNWVTFDGSTATISGGEGKIKFNIKDFSITDGTTVGTGLSGIAGPSLDSKPGLELDNGIVSLVWSDAELSYAQVTFIVPNDYVSGGAFRVLIDQSNSLSRVEVDFEVYVNTANAEGSAWSIAHYDEAFVANPSLKSGSPATVTLTPTATLSAGKIVTLNIWRSNQAITTVALGGANANATADLEVYYVEFFYSKN